MPERSATVDFPAEFARGRVALVHAVASFVDGVVAVVVHPIFADLSAIGVHGCVAVIAVFLPFRRNEVDCDVVTRSAGLDREVVTHARTVSVVIVVGPAVHDVGFGLGFGIGVRIRVVGPLSGVLQLFFNEVRERVPALRRLGRREAELPLRAASHAHLHMLNRPGRHFDDLVAPVVLQQERLPVIDRERDPARDGVDRAVSGFFEERAVAKDS